VLFTIPQAERVVTLRVGQNLDVTTGQVVEPYNPKAAEMKRAVAAKQEAAVQASRQEQGQVSQHASAVTSGGQATPSNSAGAEVKKPASLAKPAP
jgi:hypothetical protein